MWKCKDFGIAEKLLPVLLSTGMVLGLVLLLAQFMQAYMVRADINQRARASLLEMESLGYLPEANRAELEQALYKLGLTNVSLAGTTNMPVNYGEPIYLCIEGQIRQGLGLKIPYVMDKDYTWILPVSICETSTAKH